jgi:hypothetical protein
MRWITGGAHLREGDARNLVAVPGDEPERRIEARTVDEPLPPLVQAVASRFENGAQRLVVGGHGDDRMCPAEEVGRVLEPSEERRSDFRLQDPEIELQPLPVV